MVIISHLVIDRLIKVLIPQYVIYPHINTNVIIYGYNRYKALWGVVIRMSSRIHLTMASSGVIVK